MKNKYKYAVVVLVYRNDQDLEECINSFYNQVKDCKIVIVNAFYDNESMKKIKKIADSYNCDFINEVNKGYSYGNNRGIEYINRKYDYDYIIISNPDIIVKQFKDNFDVDGIIAPKIICASGKNQNPMMIKECKVADYFIYIGFKKNIKLLYALGIGLKKIKNKIYSILYKNKKNLKIFAAHGSFVIISRNVTELINPLYDENLFLFAEEGVLAYKARDKGIYTNYNDNIVVVHKEDGCMRLADFSINNELKKANIYFYENYVKNNSKRG